MHKIFLISLLLVSQLLFAEEIVQVQKMKCSIDGCNIQCTANKGELKHMGFAKSVTLKIHSNGVSIFELEHELGQLSTIIVGPKTYLCLVTGQESK